MKKNHSRIAAVIVVVLLVYQMIQIQNLKEDISWLRSSLDNQINTMNNQISNIYGDVRNMLEEESDQLAVSEWQYGEIDVDDRTAEVIFTVVPKVYNPDTTLTSVVCNGQEWKMDYDEGRYITKIELPLFDRTEVTQVKLTENGTIRTQELDWTIEPRYEALLLSYAGMSGSSSGKNKNNEFIWSTKYSVHIDVERKGEFQIQSVEFVEILDGEEISRTPVDISNEGQQAYAEKIIKKGEAVPEYIYDSTDETDHIYEGHRTFLYFFEKDYHIPKGSMLEFYVDVVDGNGLRYRSFVESMAITADGKQDDLRMEELRMYSFAEPVLIFDEAGNVVYEVEEGLFR